MIQSWVAASIPMYFGRAKSNGRSLGMAKLQKRCKHPKNCFLAIDVESNYTYP